jgi:hypothetical protein
VRLSAYNRSHAAIARRFAARATASPEGGEECGDCAGDEDEDEGEDEADDEGLPVSGDTELAVCKPLAEYGGDAVDEAVVVVW